MEEIGLGLPLLPDGLGWREGLQATGGIVGIQEELEVRSKLLVILAVAF